MMASRRPNILEKAARDGITPQGGFMEVGIFSRPVSHDLKCPEAKEAAAQQDYLNREVFVWMSPSIVQK